MEKVTNEHMLASVASHQVSNDTVHNVVFLDDKFTLSGTTLASMIHYGRTVAIIGKSPDPWAVAGAVIVKTTEYPTMCGGKLVIIDMHNGFHKISTKLRDAFFPRRSLETTLREENAGLLNVLVTPLVQTSPIGRAVIKALDSLFFELKKPGNLTTAKAAYGFSNNKARVYMASLCCDNQSDRTCCPYCGADLEDDYCGECCEYVDVNYDDEDVGCRDDWVRINADGFPSGYLVRHCENNLAISSGARADHPSPYRHWDDTNRAIACANVWSSFYWRHPGRFMEVKDSVGEFVQHIKHYINDRYAGQGFFISSNVGCPEVEETAVVMSWLFRNEDYLRDKGIHLLYTEGMGTNPNVAHHYIDNVFVYMNPKEDTL